MPPKPAAQAKLDHAKLAIQTDAFRVDLSTPPPFIFPHVIQINIIGLVMQAHFSLKFVR